MKALYSVNTWDADLQKYTPQAGLGVPSQNVSWIGLGEPRVRCQTSSLERAKELCLDDSLRVYSSWADVSHRNSWVLCYDRREPSGVPREAQ